MSVTARTDGSEAATPGARDDRLPDLTRLKPAHVWIGLALMLALMGAFLYYETRGTTLWFDEWIWALDRRGSDPSTFLDPHNSHLSLVPIAIYKLLFATAGLDHYGPYRVLVIGAHLVCVALVFVYAGRRAGVFVGLLAAALLLFLGPAWQNIIWPFQVGWLISLGAGVAAFIALDRHDRAGDVAASGLLAISLASSGIGLPIALGLAVDVLWGRRRWRGVWIVAAPLALYGLWWIGYQDSTWIGAAHAFGFEHPVTSGIVSAPAFVANSAAAAMAALAGLGGRTGPGGEAAGTLLLWGPSLGVAVAGAAVWRLGRGPFPPRLLSLLAVVLSFWCLTAVSRGFISAPYTSRYLYVGGLFLVLLAVEALRGIRLTPRASLVLAVGVAAAAVSNVDAFRDGASYLRSQAELTRVQVGALDITRPIVKPDFEVNPFFGIHPRPYFAAAREFGTPAAPPDELATDPENLRMALDSLLTQIHAIAPRAGSSGLRLGSLPQVDSVSGGSVSHQGPCVSLRPTADSAGPSAHELQVTVPPRGILVRVSGGLATVGVRRFADGFQTLGQVAASSTTTVRIRRDLADRPWHLQVAPSSRATVCGLE